MSRGFDQELAQSVLSRLTTENGLVRRTSPCPIYDMQMSLAKHDSPTYQSETEHFQVLFRIHFGSRHM